jgi:hypothetical protein
MAQNYADGPFTIRTHFGHKRGRIRWVNDNRMIISMGEYHVEYGRVG